MSDNQRQVAEDVAGPFDWCDRCRGFGILSIPVSNWTATMVECECRRQPHWLDVRLNDGIRLR